MRYNSLRVPGPTSAAAQWTPGTLTGSTPNERGLPTSRPFEAGDPTSSFFRA